MNASTNDSGIVVAAGRTERAVALDVVRELVDALGHRDLAAAQRLLMPEFTMTIPGNRSFRSLAQFLLQPGAQLRESRYSLDSLEACESAVGVAVYACGTMSGSWADGVAFRALRFCARFQLQDGRVREMQLWNDLAEFRPR